MEFRKVLESKIQGQLAEENLKVLKVEYFKKHRKLRIYCTADEPLCQKDEEVISHTTDEILGGQVQKDIAVLPRNGGNLLAAEEIRDFILRIFDKDPIAKNFFQVSQIELTQKEISFSHPVEVLCKHLSNKKTELLIEEFLEEIHEMKLKVKLIHDSTIQPNQLSMEEVGQEKKAERKIRQEPFLIKPQPAKVASLSEAKGDDRILFGKAIKEAPVPIEELNEGMRNAVIAGRIFKLEERAMRTGKYLITLYVTDDKTSITCKLFPKTLEEVAGIKNGLFVKLKGTASVDLYSKELALMVNHANRMDMAVKMDRAPLKRVELHAHTTMSTMDGIVSAKDLVTQAIAWGHDAIAITDHGVVQAYPEAMDAAGDKIKVIYGLEAYVVDDQSGICSAGEAVAFQDEYVVFDIETTGFSPFNDKIIEIGAVKIRNKHVVERYNAFVDPGQPLPAAIVELTGITDAMVWGKDGIEKVLPEFLKFTGDAVLVAHNANFDMGFIRKNANDLNLPFRNEQLDTVTLARYLYPQLKRHRLDNIAKHLGIFMGSHHRAVDDAETTANILFRSFDELEKREIFDTQALNEEYLAKVDVTRQMPYHVIIQAKNQKGLKRLYELVSESHLTYFNRNPRIPKSLLEEAREHLILGSACSNSELFRAMLEERKPEEIFRIASFYDYLEIQPLGNNAGLLEERLTEEQLMDFNRRILQLGQELNKPVVATGDVHMLKAEDRCFRHILTFCHGFAGAGENDTAMPYLTTEEMLAEFWYLGEETARKAVIDNSRLIASWVDPVLPIPKETFPPKMEGAEEEIRTMTMETAHSIYGKPLPELVQKRVDRELDSIIGNGYAGLYLVGHKLVKKSLSDGYLVGSRGSVGSSLVATFTDITEVNGLPPHYVCPTCQHSEFFTDGSVSSGVDLPEKNCPHCGTRYHQEGHDIPFETFLGFEGDKEPDIDLNFSGDNQPAIHKYCEVLFGEGYVFRAGTITTVAEKTAIGYVLKFLEEKNQTVPKAEMERLALGCTGIKRSTGQHPGGIMVVPSDNDIHNFTPIQRPADDVKTDIITTHFDYHSISGRLLKLDILGHDDPTMLRMLSDITGIDPVKLPLSDPRVLSLFMSTEALGVSQEALGSPVGTIGIPEFGTRFVRQMLVDTKPRTFSDLVRISGLSHGTDVWLNNAQDYIKNGDTDLAGCISLRDNIMLYLIQCGLPSKESFFITEKVRKGKGLKSEEETLMREHHVPEWYIESCKKIKYMFPKGHAVAYVMMAVRIAWFKVYHPLAYYATYFSVRAKDFDGEIAMKGESAVKACIDEITEQGNQATAKDQNVASTMEVVYEMYKRGYSFAPLDIYKSHGTKFLVEGNQLIPPFNSLNGLGDNAAMQIYEEAGKGNFISKEDFKERTRATRTIMEALERLGCFDGLGDTNQISFFN